MKRKQFTEEKIISILKENEASASVPNLSRRHGVSEQSIYRWKAKYSVWRSRMPSDCAPWSRRMRSSSVCSRTVCSTTWH